MKHLKRSFSVFLAVIMIALLAVTAWGEMPFEYTLSYSYDENTGTLTLSKNTGDQQLECSECALVGYLEAGSFGLTSIHTLIFEEDCDDITGFAYDYSTNEPRSIQVEQYYDIDLIVDKNTNCITGYQYPQILINKSMRSSVVPAYYYCTNDGRKIAWDYSTFEEEGYLDALHAAEEDGSLTGAEREQWIKNETERIAVEKFNNYLHTSFHTAAECKSFVSDMVVFYPNMMIYCKKGSEQQAWCDDYGGKEYILLDDSTSKTDPSTGVKTTFNNGTFGTAAVSIGIRKVKSNKANEVSFSIVPTDENGNKVEPNKAIEISLPIPAGWNASDIQVRHDKDDGTSENLEFVVNDNNALFYTSSCSVFSLVNTAGVSAGEQSDEPDPETPAPDPVTQPSKEDTKPSLNFFQRIIQWFRDLFARLFGR